MTRDEFLRRLSAALESLPDEEREAALEYYEEYFADAGPENEQDVLEELGSPEEAARQILAGSSVRDIVPTPPPRRTHWWWLLAGAIGSPVLFPLLIVAAVLIPVFIVIAVVMLFVFFVVVFALLVSGAVGLASWVMTLGGLLPGMDAFIPDGVAGLGMVLSSLGLGLMLLGPCAWVISKGFPRAKKRLHALVRDLRIMWKRRKTGRKEK